MLEGLHIECDRFFSDIPDNRVTEGSDDDADESSNSSSSDEQGSEYTNEATFMTRFFNKSDMENHDLSSDTETTYSDFWEAGDSQNFPFSRYTLCQLLKVEG